MRTVPWEIYIKGADAQAIILHDTDGRIKEINVKHVAIPPEGMVAMTLPQWGGFLKGLGIKEWQGHIFKAGDSWDFTITNPQ